MRIEELKQLCLACLRECRVIATRFLTETFPERQILIRELDRMSIYRLGRGPQLGLAAFAIMTSGWAIAVVIGLVFGGPSPRPREVGTVVAVKLEPAVKPPISIPGAAAPPGPEPNDEAAVAEEVVSAGTANGGAAEVPVDVQGDVLFDVELANQAMEPGEEPAARDGQTSKVGATVQHLADAARSCGHAAVPAAQAHREGDAVLDRLRTQLAAISERVFALATRGLGASAPAEDARGARIMEEEGEAAALAQMASLERHVDRLASGVSALRSAENELLREFQPQLAYFIATAERVIERAGMDLDDVYQERTKPRRTAEGGPFIAAISGPMAAERAVLQSDLAYWQALRALVKRMPLAAPLDRYAISSSYGTRRDPLNNRQAMHHGLDLISAPNTPIRAPAPGIVVFAGRNGGYGNMVEIDHGRSLRTRYAHLRTIKVKAGEKVDFQQKLGTLGNSGRSTGAHLHYEILIAGKPADPLNFIKAGQHVFQE